MRKQRGHDPVWKVFLLGFMMVVWGGCGGGANSSAEISAQFQFQPSSPEMGETVSFDASDSTPQEGEIKSYQWKIETGEEKITKQGANIQHTFFREGSYEVTLSVADAGENQDSISKTISVTPAESDEEKLRARFEIHPLPRNPGGVEFDASSSEGDIQTYNWNFGDETGDSSNKPVITHTYTGAGTVEVSLTVVEKGKDDSAKQDFTVKGKDLLVPSFQAKQVQPKREHPGTFRLDASGSQTVEGLDIALYEWDIPGLEELKTGESINHTFEKVGSVPVTLTIKTNENEEEGFADSLQKTIPVKRHPKFLHTPDLPVSNEPVELIGEYSTSPAGPVQTYEWQFGDGTVIEGEEPTVSHTYDRPGTYQVTLTIYDEQGFSSISRSLEISPLEARIEISPAPEAGREVILDGSGSASGQGEVTSYTWEVEEKTGYTGETAPHTFQEAGRRKVKLIVSSETGTDTAIRRVQVLPPGWTQKRRSTTNGGVSPQKGNIDSALTLMRDSAGQWIPYMSVGVIHGSPVVADLAATDPGVPAVVVADDNGTVHAIDASGGELWTNTLENPSLGTPAVADVTGGKESEVLIGDTGFLYCLNSTDGSEKWRFEKTGSISGAPSVADLTADGDLEVVVGDDGGKVYALNGEGDLLWKKNIGNGITGSPALVDLIGGSSLEVVVADRSGVYRISASGKEDLKLMGTGGPTVGSPAIADLTGNGRREIVVADQSGTITSITPAGSVLWQKTINQGGEAVSLVASPAVADLRGNGLPEVVIGTKTGTVFCFGTRDGKITEEWTYSEVEGKLRGAPAIANVTGKNLMDVVLVDRSGTLYCLDRDGTENWRFPGESARAMGNSFWDRGFNGPGPGWGSPVLADVSGDGQLEIVVGAGFRFNSKHDAVNISSRPCGIIMAVNTIVNTYSPVPVTLPCPSSLLSTLPSYPVVDQDEHHPVFTGGAVFIYQSN